MQSHDEPQTDLAIIGEFIKLMIQQGVDYTPYPNVPAAMAAGAEIIERRARSAKSALKTLEILQLAWANAHPDTTESTEASTRLNGSAD